MNAAFLIIDVQKAFVGHLKNERIYEDTLAFINATSAQFRKANQPVIVICDIEEGNDETFDNVDELMIDSKDIQ
jgi:nicotinamidase-related amidase